MTATGHATRLPLGGVASFAQRRLCSCYIRGQATCIVDNKTVRRLQAKVTRMQVLTVTVTAEPAARGGLSHSLCM